MVLTFRDREEILRFSIKNYLVQNPDAKDAEICKHFVKQGYKERTIRCSIKRMRLGKPIQQKNIGFQSKICTSKTMEQLRKGAINKLDVSIRKMAAKASRAVNVVVLKQSMNC